MGGATFKKTRNIQKIFFCVIKNNFFYSIQNGKKYKFYKRFLWSFVHKVIIEMRKVSINYGAIWETFFGGMEESF